MNKQLIAATFFLGGTIVGFFASKYILEKKYDRIAQEGVDQVIDKYKRRCEEYDEMINTYRQKDNRDIASIIDVNKKEELNEVKHVDDSSEIMSSFDKVSSDYRASPISIISDDEFGKDNEYDCVTYTYYKDSVLVDDIGDVVEDDDISRTVGHEALDKLESGDNIVYVKNDTYHMYYEICSSDYSYEYDDEDGYNS